MAVGRADGLRKSSRAPGHESRRRKLATTWLSYDSTMPPVVFEKALRTTKASYLALAMNITSSSSTNSRRRRWEDRYHTHELVRGIDPETEPGMQQQNPGIVLSLAPKVGPRQSIPEFCKVGDRLNKTKGKIVNCAARLTCSSSCRLSCS